jgi:nitronate monooxygenase
MGADFAYIGSAFIATHEARASDLYKQCVVSLWNAEDGQPVPGHAPAPA